MSILFAQFFVLFSLFTGIKPATSTSYIATSQDVSKIIKATIHPYKSVTNAAFFKIMVLSSPDCSVEYLNGFDFEWGHQYRVRLKETTLANPPMDGSSLEYELLEILSDTKMPDDYSFSMWLSRDLYLGIGDVQESNLVYINDSTYRYMEQINLVFGTDKKVLMDQVLLNNKELKARFSIVNENTIRLK
jgi:hypothetical protein